MTRRYCVPVIHNHQPEGNDPRIVEQVAQLSYRPLLEALEAAPWLWIMQIRAGVAGGRAGVDGGSKR